MVKIPIQLPKTINPNNDFCTSFEDCYLEHQKTIEIAGKGWHSLSIWDTNGNEIDTTGTIPTLNSFSPHNLGTYYYEEVIYDDIFLLYDMAGLNYAHFFFNLFGKCLYFDELPVNKIGICEDFYQTEGNSTFIKQWLDLYFEGKDVEIIVFKRGVRYKIANLIIPNTLYSFPMSHGDELIIEKIIETSAKIPTIETKSKGCYISRQDTIKRGWYHSRDLINEVELIEKIKSELGYDIIELMDYDMIGKIQIFKSYKHIIQQSSASNISLMFSTENNVNTIITHPKMEGWLGYKCKQFSDKSKTGLILLNGAGECINPNEKLVDINNLSWEIDDIDAVIGVLKDVDKNLDI